MINGTFAINFHSFHDNGDGIIVAADGKINGGDKFCVYRGTYSGEGGALEARIHVTMHNPGGVTIFGAGVKDFHLKLTGTSTGANLHFSGHVEGQAGMKMSLTGKKLSDLE